MLCIFLKSSHSIRDKNLKIFFQGEEGDGDPCDKYAADLNSDIKGDDDDVYAVTWEEKKKKFMSSSRKFMNEFGEDKSKAAAFYDIVPLRLHDFMFNSQKGDAEQEAAEQILNSASFPLSNQAQGLFQSESGGFSKQSPWYKYLFSIYDNSLTCSSYIDAWKNPYFISDPWNEIQILRQRINFLEDESTNLKSKLKNTHEEVRVFESFIMELFYFLSAHSRAAQSAANAANNAANNAMKTPLKNASSSSPYGNISTIEGGSTTVGTGQTLGGASGSWSSPRGAGGGGATAFSSGISTYITLHARRGVILYFIADLVGVLKKNACNFKYLFDLILIM